MAEVKVVVTAEGTFRETITREPIVLTKVFEAYAKTLEFVMPLLAKDTYMVTTKSQGWALIRRIRTLFFNSRSFMTVTASSDKPEAKPDVKIYPWCCYQVLQDPVTKRQPEVVPSPAAVPFRMELPESAAFLHLIMLNKDLKYSNSGVALIDLRTGKSHHPPLPNVYSDGRLCNGSDTDRALIAWTPALGLEELSKLSAKEFDNGVWNCDLIGGDGQQCAAIVEFHKYDTETKKAQPWPSDWNTRVRVASPGVDMSSAVQALMAKGWVR